MKPLGRIFLVAVATMLAWWLWTAFFPNDEKLIRKHLAGTAAAASFTGEESPLARIGKIAELADHFTLDVTLSFDVPREGRMEITGRDEILAVAARVRGSGRTVKVEFVDVTPQIAADKQSATAILTALAKVPGEENFSIQELKFFLKKVGGRWLIHRMETVKTLSQNRNVKVESRNSGSRQPSTFSFAAHDA